MLSGIFGGGGSSKQRPTQQERALAKRGAREFNDYVARYAQRVEPGFYEHAMASPSAVEGQRGAAHADAAMAHAEGRRGLDAAMAGGGAAPGSGRAVLAGSDLAGAMGEGSGAGQAVAERGVHDREQNARVRMSAYGRGLSDQSSVNLRQSGARAQQEAHSAQQRALQNRQAMLSTAATVGGLGASAVASRPMSGVSGVMRGSEQDQMLAAQTQGLRGGRFF